MLPVSCNPGVDFCSTSIVLIKLLPRGCFFQIGLAQRGQAEWRRRTQHLMSAQRLLTEGTSSNRTWQHSCYAHGFKWEKRISKKWTATLSLVCGEFRRIIILCPRWFVSLAFLEVFWPNRAVKVPKGSSCSLTVCDCSSTSMSRLMSLSFSLFAETSDSVAFFLSHSTCLPACPKLFLLAHWLGSHRQPFLSWFYWFFVACLFVLRKCEAQARRLGKWPRLKTWLHNILLKEISLYSDEMLSK